MAQTVLITGANRGIGLALVREYVARGDTVLATCRAPQKAEALRGLAAEHGTLLHVLQLDVTDESSVRAACKAAAAVAPAVDLLINNAGVGGMDSESALETLELGRFHDTFETNSLGPIRVTRGMLELLKRCAAARVVNISSGAGHITGKTDHRMYAYGASKAALNFLTRALAAELKPLSIAVIAMSPGWVKTDMGGPQATLDPAESAAGIARTADGVTLEATGQWFSYDGTRRQTW
jgi:NAD(P)-dependent dehydrogenase (short-subunit alcohol dehydrogenase family)